jgi:hypothetical protein
MFYASINDNNVQSAVLWGIRSNTSDSQGLLRFDKLAVSQPGLVEFKLYWFNRSDAGEFAGRGTMKTIGIFSLNVKDDPEATQQQQCVYLFHSNMYPRYGLESDQNSDFPRVRGVLWVNSRTFLLSLSVCLDVWKSWQVDAWITPDASIWVLYRAGIDSIWTGVGLPTETMTH